VYRTAGYAFCGTPTSTFSGTSETRSNISVTYPSEQAQ